MAEALSRLIPNADGRLILVIRHRKVAKCLNDVRIVTIDGFVSPREHDGAAIRFDGDSAVAIELDLEDPFRPVCKLRDGSAVHRVDELGFSFWKGTQLLVFASSQ